MTTCPTCRGDGEITVYPSGSTQDPLANYATCPTCKGVTLLTPRQLDRHLAGLPEHAREEAEAWLERNAA